MNFFSALALFFWFIASAQAQQCALNQGIIPIGQVCEVNDAVSASADQVINLSSKELAAVSAASERFFNTEVYPLRSAFYKKEFESFNNCFNKFVNVFNIHNKKPSIVEFRDAIASPDALKKFTADFNVVHNLKDSDYLKKRQDNCNLDPNSNYCILNQKCFNHLWSKDKDDKLFSFLSTQINLDEKTRSSKYLEQAKKDFEIKDQQMFNEKGESVTSSRKDKIIQDLKSVYREQRDKSLISKNRTSLTSQELKDLEDHLNFNQDFIEDPKPFESPESRKLKTEQELTAFAEKSYSNPRPLFCSSFADNDRIDAIESDAVKTLNVKSSAIKPKEFYFEADCDIGENFPNLVSEVSSHSKEKISKCLNDLKNACGPSRDLSRVEAKVQSCANTLRIEGKSNLALSEDRANAMIEAYKIAFSESPDLRGVVNLGAKRDSDEERAAYENLRDGPGALSDLLTGTCGMASPYNFKDEDWANRPCKKNSSMPTMAECKKKKVPASEYWKCRPDNDDICNYSGSIADDKINKAYASERKAVLKLRYGCTDKITAQVNPLKEPPSCRLKVACVKASAVLFPTEMKSTSSRNTPRWNPKIWQPEKGMGCF